MSARARPSPRGLGWPQSAGRSVLASVMARAGGRLRPRPKSPGRRRGMGIFAVLGLSRARPHFRSSHVSREGMVNPRPPLMSLNWE